MYNRTTLRLVLLVFIFEKRVARRDAFVKSYINVRYSFSSRAAGTYYISFTFEEYIRIHIRIRVRIRSTKQMSCVYLNVRLIIFQVAFVGKSCKFEDGTLVPVFAHVLHSIFVLLRTNRAKRNETLRLNYFRKRRSYKIMYFMFTRT